MNLHDRVRIEMSMVNFLALARSIPALADIIQGPPEEVHDEPELPDPEPEPPPVNFELSREQREKLVERMKGAFS